jgi:hypothetical protein
VAVSVAVCRSMRGHLGARTPQATPRNPSSGPRLAYMRRQLPKLDVAGSTPVARSRRNPVEHKGFLDLRPQRVVARIREGSPVGSRSATRHRSPHRVAPHRRGRRRTRSTPGSPKASTPANCKTPRRCWRSWLNTSRQSRACAAPPRPEGLAARPRAESAGGR